MFLTFLESSHLWPRNTGFVYFLFHLGSSYCHWLLWEDFSPDRTGISQALLDPAANTLGVSHLVPSSLHLQKLFPHQLLSKFDHQIQDLRAVSRATKAIFLRVFELLCCVPWERYGQPGDTGKVHFSSHSQVTFMSEKGKSAYGKRRKTPFWYFCHSAKITFICWPDMPFCPL